MCRGLAVCTIAYIDLFGLEVVNKLMSCGSEGGFCLRFHCQSLNSSSEIYS